MSPIFYYLKSQETISLMRYNSKSLEIAVVSSVVEILFLLRIKISVYGFEPFELCTACDVINLNVIRYY